jgi:hypothetical protein
MSSPPKFVSITGAKERYHASHAGLYRTFALLVAQGKVPVRKLGRKSLVDVQVMDEHYDSLPAATIKPAKTTADASSV